jgi:hypothetical protein
MPAGMFMFGTWEPEKPKRPAVNRGRRRGVTQSPKRKKRRNR